ncbi:uncharacterized protein LOC129574470 [Sitodiplosis mosellana]|uniref:uncharacterized protein LOC129574470 n=1 Tax=Sitodiplosis mosellana TaxID=263140 RepID=UPI002443857C|nr:uncharacterized protein LOC129574470 [Sitodiplosis mosellana]
MRSAIARVSLKIIELLGCIACFVTKVITDLEARRVFLRNQKYSREWSLLHNITWSSAGNTFANITYGGFSLITTLMLISRCIDASSRPSLIEKIFLIVGMLCFLAMGGIVLAAFDQVPWELHDNSIILGCLSFFVALVMMYDLADPMARHVTDMTQTEHDYTTSQRQEQPHQPTPQQQQPSQQQVMTITEPAASNNSSSPSVQVNETTQITVTEEPVQPVAKPIKETVVRTQTKTVQTAIEPSSPDDIAKNGNYHRGDTIDFVQYQHLPQPEQPVFERVLLPEKKRPTLNKIADPHKTDRIVQTVHPDEYIVRESPIHRREHIDSQLHYSQMPKYAAVHHQPMSSHQRPTHIGDNHQYLDHPSSYALPSSMYKLSRSYNEHNDYEQPPPKQTVKMARSDELGRSYNAHNDYERPPPKHTVKMARSDELGRYRDPAPEHYQTQPMMVIRNYSQSMATTRAPSTATSANNLAEQRRQQQLQQQQQQHRHDSAYHRNANNSGIRKHGASHITQMNSRKTRCCTDDEVDFRKMNSSIRPGFVQSVAKMWDRRAVENSAEFNTIV